MARRSATLASEMAVPYGEAVLSMLKLWSVLLACAIPSVAAGLTIVENGRSGYAIVVAPDAPASERHGAEELQRFLEADVGCAAADHDGGAAADDAGGRQPGAGEAEGRHPFADLGQRRVRAEDRGPEPHHRGRKAARQHVRRVHVARKAGLPVVHAGGEPHPQAPARSRSGHWTRFRSRRSNTASRFSARRSTGDWAARNKTNGAHQRLDATVGGKVAYFPFVHSFDRLMPPQPIFRPAPEYFSLIDGRRRGRRAGSSASPIRTCCERAWRRWSGGSRRIPRPPSFRFRRTTASAGASASVAGGWSEEEGGAHSGPLLRFVNALAEEIEKRHPDKLIDTLAYQYTEDPPAKTRPRPNVRIRLCPIDAVRSAPLRAVPVRRLFHEEPARVGEDHRPAVHLALQHQFRPLPASLPRFRRTGGGHCHVQTERRGGRVHGGRV